MCGIAGILSNNDPLLQSDLIVEMTHVQTHRGPDGFGFFYDDGANLKWTSFGGHPIVSSRKSASVSNSPTVAFGHRRLSIIDLSTDGHQPMSYQDQRYWITYNGEIYNYIELRRELESLGHRFRSKTDTEVILAAYDEWGTECFSHFNGMWALAMWDTKTRTLVCSRDRFGVKPFYYYWDGKTFVFASEIKAILIHPRVSRSLNDKRVLDYLLSGSVDHLPGQTFFSEITQLLPSHNLVLANSNLKVLRYWNLEAAEKKLALTDNLTEHCLELLTDAARIRLRSDVPVGGTLSGGLDSSVLTCLIDQKLVNDTYNVFTAQFPGHKYDESPYVNEVMAGSKHLKLHSTSPAYSELVDDLQKLMWHQDEPFGDTSIYAHFCLMRLARQNGIKVLITGQGADEVFGGYWAYYRSLLGQLLLDRKLNTLRNEINIRTKVTSEKAYSLYLSAIYHALPPRLRSRVHSFVLHYKANWITPELKANQTNDRFDSPTNRWSHFDKYLYESLTKWSIPHLLHYDDRNSMAFGVESRAPFLDYRLVQLLFSTSDNAKISGGRMKILLRRLGAGVIPKSIIARDDKIGFFTPMSKWLLEAKDYVFDVLNSDFARNNQYISSGDFLKRTQGFVNGDVSFASPLWWGLSFYLWHDVMVKKMKPFVSSQVAIA